MGHGKHHHDVLPLLGRGKHRNPRKGACFMELASYLAGERWSDHPNCTHAMLAQIARNVNDLSSDQARPKLALLVPQVIGLNSADAAWDYELSLLAATHAMPVSAEEHQKSLAVGMLATEAWWARWNGLSADFMSQRTRDTLDQVPLAETWAREFIEKFRPQGRRHPGPKIVQVATNGIATAITGDNDNRLRDLLKAAIQTCRSLSELADEPAKPLEFDDWSPVCRAVEVPA